MLTAFPMLGYELNNILSDKLKNQPLPSNLNFAGQIGTSNISMNLSQSLDHQSYMYKYYEHGSREDISKEEQLSQCRHVQVHKGKLYRGDARQNEKQ